MNFNGYADKDIDDVFKNLGTSRRGLSEGEAVKLTYFKYWRNHNNSRN